MNTFLRIAFLLFVNISIPFSYLLFAKGFFPYKPFLAGLATYPDEIKDGVPAAAFDKIVFVLIDALRSDFVYSTNSGFQFLQSLINDGAAIPFTAHATSPTVTQPRLKAITTGSIPSFLDMILNIDESDKSSNLANQDTWLTQIKAKGTGKQVMYGDDTWLKLFPDFFDRSDGTTSFFVSDFTIVDQNVTRHVPDETKQTDWNVLILHYLGVDHIGHKSGAASVNMLPKQREMDNVLQYIYERMEQQSHLNSTLLVLCGDHGMTDAGNHGGSAPGETSAALTFVSPKFKTAMPQGKFVAPAHPKEDYEYYTKVEQSDIAPTLAGLLGFPMPLNNLGVFIENFLSLWPIESTNNLLLSNAMQMLDIVKETFPHPLYTEPANPDQFCSDPSTTADELACMWIDIVKARSLAADSLSLRESCYKFCRAAQRHLSSTASNYNINWLLTGIVVSALSVVLSLLPVARALSRASHGMALSLAVTSVGYAAMMFASSYVEEEHQFWWWILCGWFTVIAIRSWKLYSRKQLLLLFGIAVILRITRSWNQSGQKYAGAQDNFSSYLLRYPPVAPALMLLTIYFTMWEIKYISLQETTFLTSCIVFPAALSSSAFKTTFALSDNPEAFGQWVPFFRKWFDASSYGTLVSQARIVFLALTTTLVYVTIAHARGQLTKTSSFIQLIHPLLTLFLIIQTRLANIPLFAGYIFILKALQRLELDQASITLTTLMLSYFSYFAMGGTNAISSVDLSNAYNGVADFNVVAVGVLTFVSNWAGPIFWCTAGVSLLLENIHRKLEIERKARSEAAAQPVPKIVLHEPNGRKASVSSINGGLTSTSTSTSNSTSNTTSQSASSSTSPSTITSTSASRSKTTSVDQKRLRRLKLGAYLRHTETLTFFSAVSAVAVMLACHVLRQHLFVWTVFSPKFLYAVAWALGWHFVFNVLICGLLFWIG